MKLLGKSSMASFLKVVLDVVWYISIAVIALEIIFYVYAIINPEAEFEEAYIQVPCKIKALDIDFIDFLTGKLDPSTYRDKYLESHDPSNYMFNVRNTTTELRFRTHSSINLFIYLLVRLLWYTVYMFILFNLRKIFGTLRRKTPFIHENAGRMRMIGAAICVTQPILWLLLWVLDLLVIRDKFSLFGEPVTVAIRSENFIPIIFLGLVVLVISEVFRIGVQMREEQELTV